MGLGSQRCSAHAFNKVTKIYESQRVQAPHHKIISIFVFGTKILTIQEVGLKDHIYHIIQEVGLKDHIYHIIVYWEQNAQ